METLIAQDRTASIEAAIDRQVVPAFRLARAILLDDAEAEDAVQDACLTAWRQQASLRDETRFPAWFDRIVVNACRDRLRRRRKLRDITDVQVREIRWQTDAGIRAASGAIGFTDGGAYGGPDVESALAALDFEQRVVVVLRFWQDRTLEDIATRLGIPLGTVKSRLHYALRTLRTRLEADHG